MFCFYAGAQCCMEIKKYKEAGQWCDSGLIVSFIDVAQSRSLEWQKVAIKLIECSLLHSWIDVHLYPSAAVFRIITLKYCAPQSVCF